MKLVYDALLRTIVATTLSELVSIPFIIKLANPSLSAKIFDVLIFAIPVFVAMLGYNIVKAHYNNRASKKSK
jgi:hypothetical protein